MKKIRLWFLWIGFICLVGAIFLILKTPQQLLIFGVPKGKIAYIITVVGISIYLAGRFIYFWLSIKQQKSKN